MLKLTNGVTHLVYEQRQWRTKTKLSWRNHALFTRAELTIKDNDDVIVANPKRRMFLIKRTFYNLNLKIVHFCYFQNTFPFVSMSRQTDDIGKKRPKEFVEQSISNVNCREFMNVRPNCVSQVLLLNYSNVNLWLRVDSMALNCQLSGFVLVE